MNSATGAASGLKTPRNNPFLTLLRAPWLHAVLAAALLVGMTQVWGVSSYRSYLVLLICLYAVAVLGLNIPAGMLGQVSLGQGAAFGLGAYAGAVLALDYHWPILFSLLASLGLGAVLGAVMAAPSARLGVIALAVVSLGFTLVMQQSIVLLRSVTGGAEGRYGIAAPFLPGGANTTPGQLALVIIGLLLIAYLAHWYLRLSRFGRTLIAVRDNEIGASALGINSYACVVLAYAIGSALGAVSGCGYAYLNASVNADSFGTDVSVLFLLMVIFGGTGTRFGPIVGAAVIGLIPISLAEYPKIQPFLYGGLLILVMRALPRGIVSRSGGPVLDKRSDITHAVAAPASVQREDSAPVLEVTNIERHFMGLVAVNDVSLHLARGEVLALIGPNGSGKTTVLNVISSIYPPNRGAVRLFGADMRGLSRAQAARAGVGRTFQVPRLFKGLTIRETLAIALDHPCGLGVEVDTSEVTKFLQRAGIGSERLDQETGTLAHGQLRMLEIALAVLRGARLLLLDEPAAGLSAQDMDLMLQFLRHLTGQGVSIIIVEHHLDLVRAISDRVIVLNLGRIIWTGNPEDLSSSREVREAYLGSE